MFRQIPLWYRIQKDIVHSCSGKYHCDTEYKKTLFTHIQANTTVIQNTKRHCSLMFRQIPLWNRIQKDIVDLCSGKYHREASTAVLPPVLQYLEGVGDGLPAVCQLECSRAIPHCPPTTGIHQLPAQAETRGSGRQGLSRSVQSYGPKVQVQNYGPKVYRCVYTSNSNNLKIWKCPYLL